uniref:DNA-3-methyladenine glycosylase 2 family protein n=1 Tax=Thaumasiovibrio occultus TaxID=1891184 RepID=UPI000B360B79|nr:DNA-3-methyladenine glycosylase 2 family protein [Thaumasiovibrio occultus]
MNSYYQARMARDHRFDGVFYTAVKSTGIYCRPICPAPAAKEENVEYFPSAIAAASAGYRPCLRCRPETAPGSPAWHGVDTTVARALALIEQGYLSGTKDAETGTITGLADRLGVSDRYLRKLFKQKVGVSPKAYALYYQLLLAKQLLHDSALPIADIAFASGFQSLRRFNDAFHKAFTLTPTQVRNRETGEYNGVITLSLPYRPPYDWPSVRDFYAARLIPTLEVVTTTSYSRTFLVRDDGKLEKGRFVATHNEKAHRFDVAITMNSTRSLLAVVRQIRRVLDLDSDPQQIAQAIQRATGVECASTELVTVRLPGIWSPFEAGIRAIVGQQVSVAAARTLVSQIVTAHHSLSDNGADESPSQDTNNVATGYFPDPHSFDISVIDNLGMPERRRQTLRDFVVWCREHPLDQPDELLTLKGIGPWTVNYMKMRGVSDPDIWLDTDLGIKRALEKRASSTSLALDANAAKPWRSYLTLYLWSQLHV